MPFRDEKNYIVIIVIMYLNSHFMQQTLGYAPAVWTPAMMQTYSFHFRLDSEMLDGNTK